MEEQGLSVISWVNNDEIYRDYVRRSMAYPKVQFIKIGKEAKNIGQAYNMGMKKAKYKLKAYVHQDFCVVEPGWLNIVRDIFKNPNVGLVGFIGALKYTRGKWWEMPNKKGRILQGLGFLDFGAYTGQADVVDALGFVSNTDIPFDESYPSCHGVDIDYCRTIKEHKLEVWIANALVMHGSGGVCDENWNKAMEIYQNKWNI
jgi:hypothetical protein